jgi:hypothetical protein
MLLWRELLILLLLAGCNASRLVSFYLCQTGCMSAIFIYEEMDEIESKESVCEFDAARESRRPRTRGSRPDLSALQSLIKTIGYYSHGDMPIEKYKVCNHRAFLSYAACF